MFPFLFHPYLSETHLCLRHCSIFFRRKKARTWKRFCPRIKLSLSHLLFLEGRHIGFVFKNKSQGLRQRSVYKGHKSLLFPQKGMHSIPGDIDWVTFAYAKCRNKAYDINKCEISLSPQSAAQFIIVLETMDQEFEHFCSLYSSFFLSNCTSAEQFFK